MRLIQKLFGRLFARKRQGRLTADEKVRALEFVIAEMKAQAKQAGHAAYLEDEEGVEK